MTSRYEVTLNDVKMSSLNKNLLILDVAYTAPNFSVKQQRVSGLDGYDISNVYLDRQEITVSFELHIYGTAERNAACQAVNKWAKNGGVLKINDRSNQYVKVRCSKFATVESVRNWTDSLTITFSTVGVPYWQSSTINQKTLTGRNVRGVIAVGGNYGNTLVSVEVTANERITSLLIESGDTKIVLKGLSVAKNKKVIIDYVDDRFLRISVDGSSILEKLQPESTDNLRAVCGANTSIAVIANDKITALFKARGLYL